MPWPPSGDFPNPGIKPRSPTLQADSLPSGQRGKPMNTGVGSLSLLQGTFPTQGSNPGLLHYRQILYQLSYQGNPCSLAAAAAKSLLSCLILCDPVDCSPPCSSVLVTFQARILEWVAMASFRRSSQPRNQTQIYCIADGFFTI